AADTRLAAVRRTARFSETPLNNGRGIAIETLLDALEIAALPYRPFAVPLPVGGQQVLLRRPRCERALSQQPAQFLTVHGSVAGRPWRKRESIQSTAPA